MFWADAEGCGVLPAECSIAKGPSGAGDAMGAAVIDGCVRRLSTEECARLGNLASARSLTQELMSK